MSEPSRANLNWVTSHGHGRKRTGCQSTGHFSISFINHSPLSPHSLHPLPCIIIPLCPFISYHYPTLTNNKTSTTNKKIMKDDTKPGAAPGMNHADVAIQVQADKDLKGIERNTKFLKIDMHT